MSFWKKPVDDEPTVISHVYTGVHNPIEPYSNNTITNTGTWGTTISIADHIIQGKMLVVEYEVTAHEAQFMDDNFIKQMLIKELAQKIYNEKCVEFTKQNDLQSNTIKCRARIYVTPDSNVKILRTHQK